MKIYIKSESEYSDIEFHRVEDNGLYVGITEENGCTSYFLSAEEVKALVDFINLTNE